MALDDFNQLKSFHEMLNDLPDFVAQSIRDKYLDKEKRKPFNKVSIDKKVQVIFDEFNGDGSNSKLDIIVEITVLDWKRFKHIFRIVVLIKDKAENKVMPNQTKKGLIFLTEIGFSWSDSSSGYIKFLDLDKDIDQSKERLFFFINKEVLPKLADFKFKISSW